MPEVHVPKLDDHAGGRSIFKFVLEVAMIGVGVFLGLTGEQWRETRHQRELAQQALRRFKVEIEANRTAVKKVEDYHAKLFEQLRAATKMTPAERDSLHIKFEGVQPPVFTHAAWDLALATQALSYVDPDVAYSLSQIYRAQDRVDGLTSGVTQSMYFSPPALPKNEETFLAAVLLYYGDMILFEPGLVKMYDELLPKIDKTLGTESH